MVAATNPSPAQNLGSPPPQSAFRRIITASEGCHPFNGDSKNQTGRMVQKGTKWYVKDLDGYLGGGDRLYRINAISWRRRIAQYFGLAVAAWAASGRMQTPPRTLPQAIVDANLGPAMW